MTRVRRPFIALVLALVLSSSALAGCTTARNLLDNGNSQCFRVLPEARKAVGSHAKFAGVLRMRGAAVAKVIEDSATHETPPSTLQGFERNTLCVVGFTGVFHLATVVYGWAGAGPGPYRSAAVVVNPADDQVVVSLLYRRFPHSLGFRELL